LNAKKLTLAKKQFEKRFSLRHLFYQISFGQGNKVDGTNVGKKIRTNVDRGD